MNIKKGRSLSKNNQPGVFKNKLLLIWLSAFFVGGSRAKFIFKSLWGFSCGYFKN